ncbi:hypothetical protein C1701_12540 [Actinoalloteichus sp. AHMU CJ021]|uniref:CGNR zinc finger domain-containing protein n=1 Tax=Actinoalloteichus TaxID=65496 RepID=UPI00047CD417|nr:CGNR zinc finger domain-containing protein [Actinoalloteichus caeruleus]AUS79046.1 hypothetical protein C1701_12540 [Actinoalloteichus sp. AHMU CJ021]
MTEGPSVTSPHDAEIELLIVFMNTADAERGTDLLDSGSAWERWVAERGLGEPGDAQAARRVRDALRAAAGAPGTERVEPPRPWPVAVTLLDGVPALTSEDAIGTLLITATRLAVLGTWDRVKICPADTCLWAFYDRSRNRSRSWCSMRVCGNRAKSRNWRHRARE